MDIFDSDAGIEGEIKEHSIRTSFRISFLFLLFFFRFSFFFWIKLGLFLLFPFAFVFFPLITHIYFSLFENELRRTVAAKPHSIIL